MISYSPPKSQAWGHRIGRLSASKIVDIGLQFIEEQCSCSSTPESELGIGWMSDCDSNISRSVNELIREIGEPITTVDVPSLVGTFRQNQWTLSSGHLVAIASWFDLVREPLKHKELVATCGTCWGIQWRINNKRISGGMFGIHLGQPHRLTTAFTFPDISHYEIIKRYLSDIGLVKLSDTHIRPKTALRP